MNELYQKYEERLGERDALYRICMKFDIYWNEDIYETIQTRERRECLVGIYITRTNMKRYFGKTFDNTIDEEFAHAVACAGTEAAVDDTTGKLIVPAELQEFWGYGFPPEAYFDLDRRWKHWTSPPNGYQYETPNEESVLKQIVLTEWKIMQETLAGHKTEGLLGAFDRLLGSANLKPAQTQGSSVADQNTFGVLAKIREGQHPIPEPDPEWEDVDGIKKYIYVWFYGHLAKMLKLNHSALPLYEKEMAKYRVARPESEDEDDESLFEDIFGSDEP